MSLFCFGYGYSAKAVARRLAPTEVFGTRRGDPAVEAREIGGARLFRFDGSTFDDSLAPALARCETLLVSIPPGVGPDPTIGALRDALMASRALGTILYLSTIGVYGDAGGGWVDESTPPQPTSARAKARVAAEDAWSALGARMGVAVHVLRLAGIYGPGRNVLEKLRRGEAKRIVKPGQVFNRTYVDDIAAVAQALLERRPPSGIWNVADGAPAPPQDVIAFGADLLGIPRPPEVAFDDATISGAAREFYADSRRVSIEKARRELGFQPLYPSFREALTALAGRGTR